MNTLNEGRVLRHKVKIHPVTCDLEKVLTEMKDRALAESEYAGDLWVDLFEEDFKENEMSIAEDRIELLVNFLFTIGKIEDDIPIDGSECIETAGKDFDGYEVWDEDIPFLGFTVTSANTHVTVYKLLYFDGETVKIFTPFNGNAVNVLSHTALGDEFLTRLNFDEVLKTDLAAEIYGSTITSEQACDREAYAKKYLEYFLEQKVETTFETTWIQLNYEAIDKEIWQAIS